MYDKGMSVDLPGPEFLTVREAARRLAVHENTIRNWVQRGILKSARKPGARFHRFEASEVERVRLARSSGPKMAQETRRVEGPDLADATRLEVWAGTQDARHVFPRLVRRLLAASSGIEELSGRAGEGISLPGWDVRATATQSSPWFPAGALCIEIGVGGSIKTKADSDYDDRTSAPIDVDPAEACFVFVTPRRWSGGAAWAAARRAEGVWRDVRVLDGDDIEAWLEAVPAAHYWISEQMGLRPGGATTAERWWRQFSAQTEPPLSPKLFLVGRDVERDQLRAAFDGAAATTSVQAAWRDDALAFICAALEVEADAPTRPVLVVSSSEVWDRLVREAGPAILIPTSLDFDLAAANKADKHVVLPLGADEVASDKVVRLPPPSRTGVRDVLDEAEIDWERAERLAALVRRSVPAFVRRLSINPTFARPSWGRAPDSEIFAPLLLAGAWQDTESDRTAIARLADKPWSQIERVLRDAAASNDPPLVQSGSRWHLASPEEAFDVLAESLTSGDLERWVDLTTEVLLESDPRDDLSPDERPMASVMGKVRHYSPTLREGLADSLALVASHGQRHVAGTQTCEDYSRRIVRTLLDNASADESGLTWRSLSDVLPRIAEAAPALFLDHVLEQSQGDHPLLLGMFRDHLGGSALSISSPHTGLLWAIETLCWSEEYLLDGCMALAQLAAIDPEGRLSNRPRGSLKNILVAWIRHTSAPLEQRLAAIDRVLREQPQVGWGLLADLWPETHGVAIPPSSPRYRDWKPNRRGVPVSEWFTTIDHLVTCSIKAADRDAERWASLARRAGRLPPEPRDRLIAALDEVADELATDPESGLLLWEAVTKEVERHRTFKSADWAMGDEPLAKLQAIADRIEPQKSVERYARLFDWRPDVGSKRSDDFAAYDAEVQRLRTEAVKDTVEVAGVEGLQRLALRSPVPRQLGPVIAEVCEDEFRDELLSWLGEGDARDLAARAWAWSRARAVGIAWVDEALKSLESADEARLAIALAVEATPDLWDLLDKTSENMAAAYWRSMSPYDIFEPAYTTLATQRLIKSGRAWAAVQVLANALHQKPPADLTPDLVCECLDAALSSDSTEDIDTSSGYELGRLLDYLESKEVEQSVLARFEWAFLRALEDHRPPRALYAAMGEDPKLFVDLVSIVYRGKSEPKRSHDEAAAAQAAHAWHVLNDWRTVPGTQDDGSIDAAELERWVREARLQLSDRDRADIGDEQIGQLLSGSPPGSDDTWPAEPVRDLLEQIGSRDIENGMHVGRLNSRGVTSRGVYDGGAQERALAAQYREWADQTKGWPRTSRLLKELAESYERDALREDLEAQEDAASG